MNRTPYSADGYEMEAQAFEKQCNDLIEAAKQDGDRDLTATEAAQFDTLLAKAEASRVKAERVREVIAIGKSLDPTRDKVPATAKRQVAGFESAQQAYDCGQWLKSHFGTDPVQRAKAAAHCRSRGLIQSAMTSGDNTLGGYLIPDAMANAVYALRSRYGVARQECQVIEMDGAVLDIPRLDTEVSAAFVGENSSISASDPGIGSIRLEPKKVAAMTVFSNEVADDALVGIVEMLTSSIAFSFAKLEDQCLFLGDGTSTYGGINGLANALQAGSRITATGQTSYSALTLASFEKVMADTKRFGGALKWYMSRVAWASGPLRLMNAVGGTSATELAEGVAQSFLGYPVVIVEDMHSSTGASTGSIAAFFGDLRQGVMFGSRKTITAKVDESRYLESDATALRVVERFDIVVADRGTASTAGGITALIFG